SAKVVAKLATKFAAVEAKGGCATTGDLPVTQATVDRCREAFAYTFSLQGVPGGDCAGDKLKALGKAGMGNAKCPQKAILAGTGVDPECSQKAADKLAAAVGKADLRVPGGCYGSAGGLQTLITACADQLRNGPSATGCFDESREGLVGAS